MPDILLSLIFPNPEQPRTVFDPEEMEGLVQSIRENGVIQAITVEQAGDHYIIHDGERRFRAARLACLETIPCNVVPPLNGTGPQERLVRALVANIQRSNLNPMEEARAFAILRDERGLSVADICRKIGKAHGYVAGRLFLLELDKPIQDLIEIGDLPNDVRAAKALMEIPDPDARLKLARGAALRRLGVRATCAAARKVVEYLSGHPGSTNQPPAIAHAFKRSKTGFSLPAWDALRQAGQLPPWPLVVESASQTCQTCALSDSASDAVCRDCPLPQLIRSMIEKTHTKRGPK